MVRREAPTRMRISRAGALNRRNGFTLFEILIVMVILALSAGVAIPLLGSFDKEGDVKSASTIVLEAVSVARSRALMSDKTVTMHFSPKKISIENGEGDGLDHTLPAGVQISSVKTASGKKNVLQFSKDGICEEAIVGLSSVEYLVYIRIFSVSGYQISDEELSFQDK